MLYSGLTSITFRKLSVEKIIEIVQNAGLDAIEWGGDIHVPHGNISKAKKVGNMSREEGIEVPSYGSYYRVACENQGIETFESVLNTALALGVGVIRVWAGDKCSQKADKEWRKKVIDESRQIASIAEKEGIRIAFEYHNGTLTDTNESAFNLLKEINHPNISTYWQPPHCISEEERCRGLKQVLPYLENIHVFYWTEKKNIRHSLEKASSNWIEYFKIASKTGRKHFAMLEFVKDDSIEQFYKDAATLNSLINIVF